jgi:hypothetical protein
MFRKIGMMAGLAFAAMALPVRGAGGESGPSPPDRTLRAAATQEAVVRGERFWRQIADSDPQPSASSRALLAYALVLCDAKVHPERLERLFVLTARMQDRDPKSPMWGNLKWYWRDSGVTDTNAVDFCMLDAATLWLRHGDAIPEPARRELQTILRLGVEGCLRHRVPTEYTNIAIMNAANLIVSGERLDRPEAAAEGCRRLDAVCQWTAALGIHEFCSPTYYGTDLNGLLFLLANARDKRQRDQASALLQLFWTDIGLNWYPAGERLGGCHSRSYDYLRGVGALDWHLWVQGWLATKVPGSAERTEPYGDQWSPPRSLRGTSVGQFPRLVRQSWGLLPAESRTHMMYRDVTLSCCGAVYGSQDMPLVVDLPGGRDSPRCYFIADGREDPYGKKRYATGSAKHAKALHLIPFWAGAQRSCDALGLAIYRAKELSAPEVFHVQSHLVLRRDVDGFWLSGRMLKIPQGTSQTPGQVAIPPGEPLVFRQGPAAVGIRVLWTRGKEGRPAAVSVVDDGNALGCLRLTVDHGQASDLHTADGDRPAGAAFWIRVGSGLARDEDFQAWRKRFEEAKPATVDVAPRQVRLEVPGVDGPVSITAEPPWDQGGQVCLDPPPCRGTLELDGREIGRPLLTAVEPLASCPPGSGPLTPIRVEKGRGGYWEAESGLVVPGVCVMNDTEASAGRYVCQPAEAIGQPNGSVSWQLDVAKPGSYRLWARVRATDKKRNSCYVSVLGEHGWMLTQRIWSVPVHDGWQWQPFRVDRAKAATLLDLPAGTSRLYIRTREPGLAIDRLFLTADPSEQP